MMNTTARRYYLYALALLALTALAGVFLRTAFAWPAVRGNLPGAYLVHAHSHAGFFGWAVMAVCALVTARVEHGRNAATLHALLAHAIGIGSFAAFVGFALRGYDNATIALSALHVFFWIVFVAAVWQPLARLAPTPRIYLRTSLAFLVAAGLATTAPVVMLARAVTDPWLLQFGVKLFLTPFVTGFLLLCAVGLLYERARSGGLAIPALILIAVGTLPSSLLYVPGAPPMPWLHAAGRLGLGLVGAGLLAVVCDVVVGRVRSVLPASRQERTSNPAMPPLVLLALGAAAVAGLVKLLAAWGVGAAFMHNRNIVIAVLHGVLLGVVTPSFIAALKPDLRAPWRTAGYAASLGIMLAAVAAAGWPWAARALMLRGIGIDDMTRTAAVAGAVSALLLLSLFAGERHAAPAADTDLSRAAGTPQRRGSPQRAADEAARRPARFLP